MIIGVPKEIKSNENRVGLTETDVLQLTKQGHSILIQTEAGKGCGISDAVYKNAGAQIFNTAEEIFSQSEMIVKVKEPLPEEYSLLKENQILYAFLHLATAPDLVKTLCDKKIKAIAYETIQTKNGNLPLLNPMSEVAGRMAVQVGAYFLQKDQGGKGILLGGIPGMRPARVIILGGGIVGINAAKMAVGLGADVSVLDINPYRLAYLDDIFQGKLKTIYSNLKNIQQLVPQADLLIGAVLLTGQKAPTLVSQEIISQMEKGSVVVDASIDQGGCIETSHPTTHENPTYTADGILHYCVTNIPSAVAQTSTYALTQATFRYCSMLAHLGVEKAVQKDPALLKGLNTYEGFICYKPVAKELNQQYRPFGN